MSARLVISVSSCSHRPQNRTYYTIRSGCSRTNRLSSVVVLVADDVVLAQVLADRDLDDLQRRRSTVLHAVDGADGQVHRLVARHLDGLTVAQHVRGAVDDYPVLAAAGVALHRQALSRQHVDG